MKVCDKVNYRVYAFDGNNDIEKKLKELQEAQAALQERDAEIERLRNHSQKILDEKKKLQKQYEGLGDPEHVKQILAQFENDEDAKLVAEGKFKDVLKKHTERLSLEYKSQLDELSKQLKELEEAKTKFEGLYHESEAGHAVSAAAIKAGIRDTAIEDVLMRAKGVFRVSEDGKLEARDKEGNLVTVENKPLTPELFVQQLKEKYPHYWPESQGAGASGGSGETVKDNPFKKGSSFNLTKQALLRKNDPELAKKLEQEANAAA